MYLHFPGPPAWNASSNDGTWDTRIAHSRTGESFSYMGDDAPTQHGLYPFLLLLNIDREDSKLSCCTTRTHCGGTL